MRRKRPAKTYMVFYQRGGHVGSVPRTKKNETEARRCMILNLIQRDVDGTEHYAILGLRRACRLEGR